VLSRVEADQPLAILDEALATSARTGHRAFEAELHRVRGEILLRRDPTNPAPAEEALRDDVHTISPANHDQSPKEVCALSLIPIRT
jgi:hypothetical protein